MELPTLHLSQLRDTAARARAQALPSALGKVAGVLQTEHQKDPAGDRLIRKCCVKGAKPDLLDLQDLASYCAMDVEVLRDLDQALLHLPDDELHNWMLTVEANARGLPVDLAAVEALLYLTTAEGGRLEAAFRRLTGFAPGQVARVLEWLGSKGVTLPDLRAETVRDALRKRLPAPVREALEARQSAAKASVKKYRKMHSMTCADHRVRGGMIYHGAKTGRINGNGVQFLNLPRGAVTVSDAALDLLREDPDSAPLLFDDIMEMASAALRQMVRAPKGYRLIVSDFSQIEYRALCWAAGQDDVVAELAAGVDPYKAMAAFMYDTGVDKVTKAQRQIGKSAVLGAGYQLGWRGFVKYCASSGLQISDEEAQKAISDFRARHDRVVEMWTAFGDAAFEAVDAPGKVVKTAGTRMIVEHGALRLRLPSGRWLSMHRPRIAEGERGPEIVYDGTKERAWVESIKTYGGDLVQSFTQALARDLMMHCWSRIDQREEYEVLLAVHDELVVLAPLDQGSLTEVERLMSETPQWAGGLPLKAAGFECTRYRKG